MVKKFMKLKTALLGAGVLGAVAISSFSVSVFAQSAVTGQQDVVRTEAQALAALSNESIGAIEAASNKEATQTSEDAASGGATAGEAGAGAIANSDSYSLSMGTEHMSFTQASPFLSKALEALNLKHTVVKSDFTVLSSYDNVTNTVTVSVLFIDPLSGTGDRGHFVKFKNVDLQAGTGQIEAVTSK